jgi:hypothetical protein
LFRIDVLKSDNEVLKSDKEVLKSQVACLEIRLNSVEMHLMPEIMMVVGQCAHDPMKFNCTKSVQDQGKSLRNQLAHPKAPGSKIELMRNIQALVKANLFDKDLADMVDGCMDEASYGAIKTI